MRSYCEGSRCSRRDLCLRHVPVENTVQEYIDWSTYGSGHYWTDETGTHSEIEHCCGDVGEFKHFEPIDKNIVSIHDCSMTPQCYIASIRLPKFGATCSNTCFTQECIEKIIDNLKSTKGLRIVSITNSETEDIVTFEIDSSIL